MNKSVHCLIKQVVAARSNLNNYHAVIALCENGLFVGPHGQKAQSKIISICKAEAQKELQRYDKYSALIVEASK